LTFIPLILIAFLVLGAFAFVFRPLFGVKNGRWWRPDASQAALTLDELVARRDAIYAALKDVEFDQETGKLASEDYQLVRTRYMAEAAQVLRQLDRPKPKPPWMPRSRALWLSCAPMASKAPYPVHTLLTW
jgi:hypothetical protein